MRSLGRRKGRFVRKRCFYRWKKMSVLTSKSKLKESIGKRIGRDE